MHTHPSVMAERAPSASMNCAGGGSDTASFGPAACGRTIRPRAAPAGIGLALARGSGDA